MEEEERLRPWNVLPRKGRRDVAHEGPCSVIFGCDVKNLFRVSVGDVSLRKAVQKDWALVRRREDLGVGVSCMAAAFFQRQSELRIGG